MSGDSLNDEENIKLEDEYFQKLLYQTIIKKVSSLSDLNKKKIDPEIVCQALELLPIFENDEKSDKEEVKAVLMLLDFISSHHRRIMSKEPIRSQTMSLIQALQDHGKPQEESKEIVMPNAFYGLAGQKRKESFEKLGEKQMQLNIPSTFTNLEPIIDQ